jgi:large subunit ribosomal protein L31
MKSDIHPENHRLTIFEDVTSGARFLVRSTAKSKDNDKWTDGKEYPHVKIEISSASHPFYTGITRTVDTTGRADKFRARVAAATKTQYLCVKAAGFAGRLAVYLLKTDL